jgi:hypothetical protein
MGTRAPRLGGCVGSTTLRAEPAVGHTTASLTVAPAAFTVLRDFIPVPEATVAHLSAHHAEAADRPFRPDRRHENDGRPDG